MNDMNNNQNEFNTSDENQNNKVNGSVSGFDSADSNRGYTVTPQGGYYTRSGADIIQDDVIKPQEHQATQSEPQQTEQSSQNYSGYSPTNGYSAPNAGGNRYYYNPNFNQKKPKVKKQPKKVSVAVVAVAVVLAVIVGAFSGVAVNLGIDYLNSGKTSGVSESGNKNLSNVNITVDDKNVESVAQAVAAKATASVVGIRTTTSVTNFFGGTSTTPGEGSGVVYTEDGYIITNYHVIESAVTSGSNSTIEVFLDNVNNTPYKATVIGYNVSSDLAVIKIDKTGLTPIEIGSSKDLAVGQYAITIGAPGGLEFMGSVTYGIISGLDRTVSSNSKVPLIQTDAAINPGNSGGALLDTSGKLIGINSSKIVSEEFEGMGFAIPVDTVVEKVDKIIKRQNEPEPYIGITVSERYTSSVLSYYGYPSGAVVLSVDSGSPADEAGIKRGDIITEFNGSEVEEYNVLSELLNDCDPGDKVEAKVYRSGRYYTVSVTVGDNGK